MVANQVQYSILDHRPERDLPELAQEHDIGYLCYGVVAGGFLSDRYLDSGEPVEPLENRSLIKYRLIIDEFGGFAQFQKVLQMLRVIADKHNTSIAEVATRYILQKHMVAGVIVGARNLDHLTSLKKLFGFSLDSVDLDTISKIVDGAKGPGGPVFGLERKKNGKHGKIMRYNLNKQRV